MERAATFFKQAIEVEPDYASAHGNLAQAYLLLFANAQRRDTLRLAREEISAALQLDPANFSALMADAMVKDVSFQKRDSYVAFQRLRQQYPNNAEVHFRYGNFLEDVGLWERAIAELQRAAGLDPLVPRYPDALGNALHFVGREREAIAEYKRALTIDPAFVFSLADLCITYLSAGGLKEAQGILRNQLMTRYAEEPLTINCAEYIANRLHDNRELKRLAKVAENRYLRKQISAVFVAYPYAFLGDYTTALHWFEKAYDDRDYYLLPIVYDPDLPAAIRSTPRWRAFMRRPVFQELASVRAQILAGDR